MKMEPTVCSETSAIRTKTPGNYPKRNKLHLEHGESLKTRFLKLGSPEDCHGFRGTKMRYGGRVLNRGLCIALCKYRVAQKERIFLKWVVVGRVSFGLSQIKSLRSKTSYNRRSESFHLRRNCNCATRNVCKCDAEL